MFFVCGKWEPHCLKWELGTTTEVALSLLNPAEAGYEFIVLLISTHKHFSPNSTQTAWNWKVEIGKTDGLEGTGERVGGLQCCSGDSSSIVRLAGNSRMIDLGKWEGFGNRVGSKDKEKI